MNKTSVGRDKVIEAFHQLREMDGYYILSSIFVSELGLAWPMFYRKRRLHRTLRYRMCTTPTAL